MTSIFVGALYWSGEKEVNACAKGRGDRVGNRFWLHRTYLRPVFSGEQGLRYRSNHGTKTSSACRCLKEFTSGDTHGVPPLPARELLSGKETKAGGILRPSNSSGL